MAVSKVVLGNQTVMDITDSTVDAGSLLAGKKAYGANGEAVTGTLVVSDRIRWSEAKTSVKKNLISPGNFSSTYPHGLSVSNNSDGSVRIYGTHNLQSGTTSYNKPGLVLEPGSYTYSLGTNALGTCLVILSKHDDASFISGDYILKASILAGSDSVTFTLSASDIETYPYVLIQLGINYTETTVDTTFYPMIRLASIEDNAYVPYIPDNVELAEDISDLADAKNFHGLEFHSEYTTPVNANNVTKNGLYHYDNGGPAVASGASATNGALYSNAYSDTTGAEIAQDYANGNLFVRGRKATAIWSGWRKVMLDYHLDQSVTLSTSDDTTVTFTDANIHADSAVDPWASVYGLVASNVVTTEGQCVVTFPKQDTAATITCRIYIK